MGLAEAGVEEENAAGMTNRVGEDRAAVTSLRRGFGLSHVREVKAVHLGVAAFDGAREEECGHGV
jgi:hypothetical protein